MDPILLGRTVWRGILGMIAEIFFTAIFISFGLLLCLFWWKVIK